MHKRLSLIGLSLALVASCLTATRSAGQADASAREGCTNQWLFNGVWRVRVMAVEPHRNGVQQDGWQVTEDWRNGTSQELAPSDSAYQGQALELKDGSIIRATLSEGQVAFNSFAPSGQLHHVQIFLSSAANASNPPKALLITFDASKLSQWKTKPQFTTSKYNFHFNLGCTATSAAAQAEGGSQQLDATPGCMNQWMSNGVWRMRVTAISYDPPDAKPQDQVSWLVTQTWQNVSGRGVTTGVLYDEGRQFVPTRVTDEYLATQGGSNVSSSNAALGFLLGRRPSSADWPPGDSWTFQQRFGGAGLLASDKPVRLLVTFDAKTQNATPGVPHYRLPANFRIDLTCSK